MNQSVPAVIPVYTIKKAAVDIEVKSTGIGASNCVDESSVGFLRNKHLITP